MIKTDFMSLYEELSVLNESKEDIAKFIDKFGEDTYELFKKSNQRLKNKGISTDLTYHVKHTDKKDLDAILLNLQNRAITKDGSLTELAGDYEYLGEDKGYKVYKINDVIASINFGAGTGWCISGRYDHYGEKNYTPTREEAEKHWNEYTKRGVQFYFFIGANSKVALALYPRTLNPNTVINNVWINETNCEIYNEKDELDYGLFQSLPVDLIGPGIICEWIPAENGLAIKDNVLFKCDNDLEKVVIPDGTTKIEAEAFVGCRQLKTVLIPDSVTSIGNKAFLGCNSLTSITIGNNVTSIGYGAFYNCIRLVSVNLPDSITSIGDSAFDGCSSLTNIKIPNSVTSIGDGAFLGCHSITSIVLPNNVTSIEKRTFYYCSGLTSIAISNSVTSIGEYAFASCSSLTSVIIPDSVAIIKDSAFTSCSGLKSVTIGSGVKSIGKAAFNGCSSLTSITIPDSVTSIGSLAFMDCRSLTSIAIPSSVTSIASNAFEYCPRLKNISVDKNNTNYKVVDGHLYDKKSKKIIFEAKEKIKTDFISAYEELSILNESKADIDNFITKFGEDTYELFKKSTQRLKNKGISTDITFHVKNTPKEKLNAILLNLQNRAITKDDNLTELAGDYKYLGEGKGYKVYKINDVVASINFGSGTGWCISGRYGHYGEKNYKPTREAAEEHWNKYTGLGVQFYFFIGNNNKVALALYPRILHPNIVIGNVLINETNYEIYNEQDVLDYSLFSSLPVDLINKHIIFEGIPAENGLAIKDDVLFKCDRNLENVAIPYGITQIDDYAFYSCTQLKTVTIPNSVTYIGDGAFSGCNNLMSITIPNSVTSIEDSAFYGCSNLTSITLPNSITYIGDWAFWSCDSLTSITIPNSVTYIRDSAFSECGNLTSIEIPDSVTSIGDYAFGECSSLTSITIGSGVKSIGDDAFDGCYDLTNIVVDKNNPNYKVVDGHLYDKNDKKII